MINLEISVNYSKFSNNLNNFLNDLVDLLKNYFFSLKVEVKEPNL
jgi:hypothetical protein